MSDFYSAGTVLVRVSQIAAISLRKVAAERGVHALKEVLEVYLATGAKLEVQERARVCFEELTKLLISATATGGADARMAEIAASLERLSAMNDEDLDSSGPANPR